MRNTKIKLAFNTSKIHKEHKNVQNYFRMENIMNV